MTRTEHAGAPEPGKPASIPTAKTAARHLLGALQAVALLLLLGRLGPQGVWALGRGEPIAIQGERPVAAAQPELAAKGPAPAPTPAAEPDLPKVADSDSPPIKPPPRVPIGFEVPKDVPVPEHRPIAALEPEAEPVAKPPAPPEPFEFPLPERVPPPLPDPPPPQRLPQIVRPTVVYRLPRGGWGPRVIEIQRQGNDFGAAAPNRIIGRADPETIALRAWPEDIKKFRMLKERGANDAELKRTFGPTYWDLRWAALLDVPLNQLPGPPKTYIDALRLRR